MELVTDTSVILAVLLNESEKRQIIKATRGYELVGPPVIPWEIGNAFSAMFKRRKLSVENATKALAAFKQLPIRYLEVDNRAAVQTANSLDIYAYDAYFLECARTAGVPIISLDKALANKAKEYGLSVLEI